MRYLKIGLASLAALLVWTACVGYGAFNGWWMSPIAPPGDFKAFSRWAIKEADDKNLGATSFVLVENGEVVEKWFSEGVDQHTLFPTASFSKWITALSVMSLVEAGQVELDAPVSAYLSRWQLPPSEFNNDDVTIRRLLSHTGGLTDRLGFGDYEAGELLPTLEDELSNPRASRGDEVGIVVGQAPGEFLYSGGGYLILELLVEEVSGVTFAEYVQRSILEPAGMTRSSHAFLGELDNVSPSYALDGSVAPTYKYASAAATGFSTSASDLSKLVSAVVNGRASLSEEAIDSMRNPEAFALGAGIWGLGTILYAETATGDYVYGHDGGNDPAINSSVRINPDTSDAYIMLETGHPSLASSIGSEWVLWQTGAPDLLSAEQAISSAITPLLLGALVIVLLGGMACWRRAG